MIIRYLFFIMLSLALLAIGFLSTLAARPMAQWAIAIFLFLVWVGVGFVFGVWFQIWFWWTGQAEKSRVARDVDQRHLESPNLAAAEKLHGRLPADVKALYQSDRRLARSVLFGDGNDDDVFIEGFLPIDRLVSNPFFLELGKKPWIAIAHDGCGNIYAARTDETKDDCTPLYFFDHEEGGEPFSSRITVQDLLNIPMREED